MFIHNAEYYETKYALTYGELDRFCVCGHKQIAHHEAQENCDHCDCIDFRKADD